MRQLGIHFGSLNIVSNYADGNDEWVGSEPTAMAQFYRECPLPVGTALAGPLIQLSLVGAMATAAGVVALAGALCPLLLPPASARGAGLS